MTMYRSSFEAWIKPQVDHTISSEKFRPTKEESEFWRKPEATPPASMTAIDSIRSRFAKEVEQNGTLYHPIDIERVQKEDWQVKRFLMEFDNDENKAFDSLVTAMRWKKEYGVHERTDQYFPKEFWELLGAEVSGRDKQGRMIQMEVVRTQHHFKELNEISRQFVAHNLERVDRMAGEDGFILIMDTNGAGMSNVDLDMIKYKMQINEYYPNGLRQMFVVDLPWLLNSVMKIIVSFMNAKLRSMLNYVKRQELLEYVDPEMLPVSLGGKREKPVIPPNLKPMEELGSQLGLTEKFIDSYYSYYKIKRTKA